MDRPDTPLTPDRTLSRILTIAAAIYVIALLAFFAFKPAGPFERDGYFHARFANLLPTFGLSHGFHWTQASTWRTQFCDKEFLFHVLMAPFATNSADPIAGVRFFSITVSAGIFVALYLVLRSQQARWPLIFALLPLCMGGPFLLRAMMIRSHVLSISLLLLGMAFMLKRKWKLLGLLGFVYAWSYTFPFLLLMTALAFATGMWFVESKFDWKLPAAAALGVTLGLAIHPYSPLTFETFLTYIHVTLTGSDTSKTALELGGEIYPMSWADFLLHLPLYTLSIAGVVLIALRARKRVRPETVGALCAALMWYLLSIKFGRFIEYGVPLTALALGLVIHDMAATEWKALEAKSALLALGAFFACLPFHVQTLSEAWNVAKSSPPARFHHAAAWMAENLEPGETVAQIFWVEFPELYYDGYRQNFLMGLDPTYTVRDNPETADLLDKMRLGQVQIHPQWLANTFHARCLIMGHKEAMKFDVFSRTNWEPVYADEFAVIFALSGRFGPPADLNAPIREKPLEFFKARAIRIKSE